jgi:hypothetical protein
VFYLINKTSKFILVLKGDHRNRTVSEIVDPVDKNLILEEQSQIEDALQQYFCNIGNHANNMQDVDNFKDNVRKRVAKLDDNLVPTTDMSEPYLCRGLIIPFCHSLGIISRSETTVKRSTSEFNMASPPFLRNSLGIPSSPTAFPLARFFKEVSIDDRENLNENIKRIP